MPTFEADARFSRDYGRLTTEQRRAYRRALREFIGILHDWELNRTGNRLRFPARLGVRPMVDQQGIMEMDWAADG